MTTPAPPVYNGRYELRRQIGRGGTAQVFLAHDLRLDRPVALKVLMSELSRDRSFVDRFRREAQAAANLTHPNIVSVFDWGESEDTYFIVMEYIDGESLASIIRTQAPLDPIQAASIGADISAALSYAHRHGVVHRDVKPGNVLITADGQVKVADFGIARAVGADDQITQTGLVMGTAAYFSPEQAQGLGVDGRSDVYALGVVLFEMLVGQTPFHGETPVSIAYQHVREAPPTPRSINAEVPLPLEAVVLQAIAKRPEDRYATADELRADLGRFVRNQPVLARPPDGATGARTEVVAAVVATPSPPTPTPPPPPVPPLSPPASDDASDDPGAFEPSPRRSTRWWVLAAIVLAAGTIGIAVVVGRNLGYFGGATYYRVPYVIGKQKSAAVDALKKAHLTPTLHAVLSTTNPPGFVYRQRPAVGASEIENADVAIYYWQRPAIVHVPEVRGLSAAAAESKLHGLHLRWTTKPVVATTTTQKQGTVLNQMPLPGAKDYKGSFVTIYVVHGTNGVKVPNIVGDTPTQAAYSIGRAGLVLGKSYVGFSPTVPAGNVVSTSPAIGTLVAPHSTVNLKTSRGPGVVIPDIVGEPVSQAEETLAGAGVTSVPTQSCVTVTDPSEVNLVQSQFPKYVPNAQVSPGHAVSFTFGCLGSTGGTSPTGGTGTTTTSTTTTSTLAT